MSTKERIELVLGFGCSASVSAKDVPVNELDDVLSHLAGSSGVTLTIRDALTWLPPDALVRLARTGQGRVRFEF